MNTIKAVLPMFDPADKNLNGKVSWAEWAYSGYVPFLYGVNDVINAGAVAAMLQDVAIQMKDHDLYQNAKKGLLSTSFKVVKTALVDMTVENFLGPVMDQGFDLASELAGFANMRGGETATMIVQEGVMNLVSGAANASTN